MVVAYEPHSTGTKAFHPVALAFALTVFVLATGLTVFLISGPPFEAAGDTALARVEMSTEVGIELDALEPIPPEGTTLRQEATAFILNGLVVAITAVLWMTTALLLFVGWRNIDLSEGNEHPTWLDRYWSTETLVVGVVSACIFVAIGYGLSLWFSP